MKTLQLALQQKRASDLAGHQRRSPGDCLCLVGQIEKKAAHGLMLFATRIVIPLTNIWTGLIQQSARTELSPRFLRVIPA
jgi:hypothetical protein